MKPVFYRTFVCIERELLVSRIHEISIITGKTPLIKCYHCPFTRASLECITCDEKLCQVCLDQIHNKLNKNPTKHNIIKLSNENNELKPNENSEKLTTIQNKDTQASNISMLSSDDNNTVIAWRKFEYYCYPTYKYSESHNEIENIFKMLVFLYLDENGIKHNTIEDAYKYFKVKPGNQNSTNYHNSNEAPTIKDIKLLNEKLAAEINKNNKGLEDNNHHNNLNLEPIQGTMDAESFKTIQEFLSMAAFNIEEKLFINRAAFMLFKRRGTKVTFNDFYKILRSLQVIRLMHI